MELDDAIHVALLTLRESYEGEMTEHNIEVGFDDFLLGFVCASWTRLCVLSWWIIVLVVWWWCLLSFLWQLQSWFSLNYLFDFFPFCRSVSSLRTKCSVSSLLLRSEIIWTRPTKLLFLMKKEGFEDGKEGCFSVERIWRNLSVCWHVDRMWCNRL